MLLGLLVVALSGTTACTPPRPGTAAAEQDWSDREAAWSRRSPGQQATQLTEVALTLQQGSPTRAEVLLRAAELWLDHARTRRPLPPPAAAAECSPERWEAPTTEAAAAYTAALAILKPLRGEVPPDSDARAMLEGGRPRRSGAWADAPRAWGTAAAGVAFANASTSPEDLRPSFWACADVHGAAAAALAALPAP